MYAARTLTPIIRSKRFGGVSRMGCAQIAPALFTRMSRRPNSRDGSLDQVADGIFIADVGHHGQRAAAQRANGVSSFVNAAGQAIGGLLALGGNDHVGAFLGSRIASALPIPRLEPVTTATRP